MLINPHVLRSSIVTHTIGSHMAQSKHVLLTRFDLITWAWCQGGSRGKNIVLQRQCPDVHISLEFIMLPGKKNNPSFSVLTWQKLSGLVRTRLRQANLTLKKTGLGSKSSKKSWSWHAGRSGKQVLFRLKCKLQTKGDEWGFDSAPGPSAIEKGEGRKRNFLVSSCSHSKCMPGADGETGEGALPRPPPSIYKIKSFRGSARNKIFQISKLSTLSEDKRLL